MADDQDPRDQHRAAEPRKATWFELYFDLSFVVAVAAFTARHVDDYTISGAAEFALQFLVIWSLWVSHTFWASLYDEDRIDQHIFGFTKILAIVAIAYSASSSNQSEVWFAGGVAAFKLLLAFAYLRDALRAGEISLAGMSILLLSLQGSAWLATSMMPEDYRLTAWVTLLIVEFLNPVVQIREDDQRLPHREHMPERFGLFTIILLGEAIASALHGLTHAGAVTRHAVICTLCGAGLSFLFWVGYFHRARSAAARTMRHLWTAATVRRWVYAHMPLYLGIAGFSTGTVVMSGHTHAGVETLWLQAVAVALAMVGLTLVGLASPNNMFHARTAPINLLLAGGTLFAAFAALSVGIPAFMMTLVAMTLLQLLLELWIGWRQTWAS